MVLLAALLCNYGRGKCLIDIGTEGGWPTDQLALSIALFGGHTFPWRRPNFLGVFQMISKIAFVAALVATSCFGATWTGKISDSACGVSHAKMRAAHTDLTSDKDCTLACIKSGSKYVLVSKGKVFQIDNQNLDDLQKYAGQNITLTGKLTGDSIEVTSIVAK
jgi:hypothetical protein